MYKKPDKDVMTFMDFDQPMGLEMDPENRWVRLAEIVPWEEFEEKYAALFPGTTGNVAKPFRLALGSLLVQNKLGCSDRELVEQLTENPYLQYFIGMPGYKAKPPINASTLVLFRKRITMEMLQEVNERMLEGKAAKTDENKKEPPKGSGSRGKKKSGKSTKEKSKKETTLIIDASCAPVNIRYPQDVSLLNESREKLEELIKKICEENTLKQPRTYKRTARKKYLAFAKKRKPSKKNIRKAIKEQLGYVRRDLGYITEYEREGLHISEKYSQMLQAIRKVYEQQRYMYDEDTHVVADRIVSISQPWIRPIVRGKASAATEFGPKLEISIDEEGYERIERVSFDAYNESGSLKEAAERYRERTGKYPERILADQIYRTRENRAYCKERGIRLSGPKLGRPGKSHKVEKGIEYQDNKDRIEVERAFSLSKRCHGMGLIMEKLEETQLTSIGISVLATNLFKIYKDSFSVLILMIVNIRHKYRIYA